MITIYNSPSNVVIRLYHLCSLIFFALFVFSSCHQDGQRKIVLIWNNNQAVAISIPESVLNSNATSLDKTSVAVRLEGNTEAMLGEIALEDAAAIFKPVIPLARGRGYEILLKNKIIGRVHVPLANEADASALTMIYPTADTLPENLLKIYLQFSKPMREGESKKYIALLDKNDDTVKNIFLDLQPELWNKERTILTIWLDPGRIKRDLIPNKILGNPLKEGERYTISVSKKWKDVQDLPLTKDFRKKFVVGVRDSLSPDPTNWVLHLPTANTGHPLEIDFGEPLDNFLLHESIKIVDGNNISIPVEINVGENGKKISFTPGSLWLTGHYKLIVDTKLEDISGNNINRPFDRDLKAKSLQKDQLFFEKSFYIRE